MRVRCRSLPPGLNDDMRVTIPDDVTRWPRRQRPSAWRSRSESTGEDGSPRSRHPLPDVDMPESQAAGWIADSVVPKAPASAPDIVAQMPERPRPARHPGHARLFTRSAWSASSSSAARTCTCTHVRSLQLAEAAFLDRRASPSPQAVRDPVEHMADSLPLRSNLSHQRHSNESPRSERSLRRLWESEYWTSEPGK